MTCPLCKDPIDATAKCAGSVVCSACAFEHGDMTDGVQPEEPAEAA